MLNSERIVGRINGYAGELLRNFYEENGVKVSIKVIHLLEEQANALKAAIENDISKSRGPKIQHFLDVPRTGNVIHVAFGGGQN